MFFYLYSNTVDESVMKPMDSAVDSTPNIQKQVFDYTVQIEMDEDIVTGIVVHEDQKLVYPYKSAFL